MCGQGTIALGSECVPATDVLVCGAGTSASGGLCVADDVSAGVDTSTAADAASAEVSEDAEQPLDAEPAPDAEPPDADVEDVEVACTPVCVGKECGDDGCGGSCGSCTSAQYPICNTALGACVATCVPDCMGRDCGDDGCGGQCGTCASGASCLSSGRCVPDAWSCDPSYYGAADPCDCECGAPDPDCADPSSYVAGCESQEVCDLQGHCASKVPAGWTCSPLSYAAVDGCDCECGVLDPDCAFEDMPIIGCAWGETCSPQGTCAACVPDCAGKSCGDDGCGGTCGACTSEPNTACHQGQCVDPCVPSPIACLVSVCGDDGCGGSCGSCPDGSECTSGACEAVVVPPAPSSCVGRCGGVAPAGCYCVSGCEADGSCCEDFADVCACKPACSGKACGSDGCGGNCGTCSAAAPHCTVTQQCSATCTPSCAGKTCGDDGCGGVCGSCGGDEVCEWTWQCVPNAWACPAAYYADGQACDCGCGVGDPDCTDATLLVFGCPTLETACSADGLCEATYCSKDADCTAGSWCRGVFAAGGGAYKGVCGKPDGSAKPPGLSCSIDAECATDACVGGLCRTYCQADQDCPSALRCVGVGVEDFYTGATTGFASVCHEVGGSGTGCASQKDCAPKGEVCAAFVAPTATFGPRYLCVAGVASGGDSCAFDACPPGQLCASSSTGFVCGLACPAGAADCPTTATCKATIFNDHGTPEPADDPTVPVCQPK